jgi:hypothetical protein
VGIKRQVRGVERHIVLQQRAHALQVRSGQRLQPAPEQAVMHDQQVGAVVMAPRMVCREQSTAATMRDGARLSTCRPLSAGE